MSVVVVVVDTKMPSCCVKGCKNYTDKFNKKDGISYHRRLKKIQRGQTLTLSFSVTSNNTGEEVTSDEINVNDLAWVRFRFSFSHRSVFVELESTMTFKRHEKAKSARVIINLSSDEFKKECICPDDWVDEVKIDPKQRDYLIDDTFIVASLEVTVIARNVTRPSSINKLFEDAEFTDFQLCAADGSVAVHKSLLPVHSDMFKTMLRGEWKETSEGRIKMPGVTAQTLQHLKEYMYLDTLPDEGLESLLLLATHYLMDTLKADCITQLVERVRPQDVHGLIKFACENNLPDLVKAILLETPDATINDIYNLEQSKEEKPNSIN